LGFSRFDGESTLRPAAANAHRWAFSFGKNVNTKIFFALFMAMLISCSPASLDTPAQTKVPTRLTLATVPPSTLLPAIPEQSEVQPNDREKYREFGAIPDLSICDMTQYPKTDLWSITENPILLGMCVAGYPNTYKLEPSLVQAFYMSRENVVVIVTDNGDWTSGAGDYIRSAEMRIDLVASDKKLDC
jgi:hypothetical protein